MRSYEIGVKGANTTLVKMAPLEAGIPDAPGMSEKLLAERDPECKSIAQILAG